jgi:leucine dehydrogenase
MHKLIQRWNGQSVVVSYDNPSHTWIFIAIHDTTLGPAMGGCRMRVYHTPDEALLDAMRLAEGMTHKWAVIGFDFGGGKSVLAVPRELHGEEREGLLRRFGYLLESLRGAYWTGEDLGTTPEDMAIVGSVSQYVHGTKADGSRPVDPGPFTALGVLVGMRAAVLHAFGNGLAGRSVLIQGAGDVGAPLARMLKEEGARLLISDLDDELAARVASEVEGEVVAPEQAYRAECDVFAPCAVGAVLNRETIPVLACRVVAGPAVPLHSLCWGRAIPLIGCGSECGESRGRWTRSSRRRRAERSLRSTRLRDECSGYWLRRVGARRKLREGETISKGMTGHGTSTPRHALLPAIRYAA